MGKLTKKELEKMRSVSYNRSGYKTSSKKTIVDARGSNQVEHFDGRLDAEIRPAAIPLTATALPPTGEKE